MKIGVATKTLADFEKGERASVEPEVHEALKLGIEALKDFKRYRGRVESGHYRILPGETKE